MGDEGPNSLSRRGRSQAARQRIRGVPVVVAHLNVFRVMLNHPELAAATEDLLATLLYKANKLDLRLRELIIMRVAWRTGSVYEWTLQQQVAERLEIDMESVAVRDWRAARLSRRHRSCGPRRNGRDFGRGPDFGRDLDRMLHLSRNRSRTD